MYQRLIFILSLIFICGFTSELSEKPKAEIALVLDLSGSTNGLLDDVRDNLWTFANSFRQSFPEHELRLAIVGFSRGSFGLESGYVRVLCDLSSNFDVISFRLYDLVSSVEKGDQFVGSALKTAVGGLSWSKDQSRKMILLFGNSRADLGGYDYNKAVEGAVDKKIIINTVYCIRQDASPKDLHQWYSIADRTGGNLYKMQVTNRQSNKFYSESTRNLIEINNNLNDTYVPFNRNSRINYDLMLAADVNSLQMNEKFFLNRCAFKISDAYQQHAKSFDLVDYLIVQKELPPIHRKFLPENLMESSAKELSEIANIKFERRKNILKRMRESILLLDSGPLTVNPIDSIFLESISRHN